MFYLLWNISPILVSIVSFFVYVARGNELTVSVAFTVRCLSRLHYAQINDDTPLVHRAFQYDSPTVRVLSQSLRT